MSENIIILAQQRVASDPGDSPRRTWADMKIPAPSGPPRRRNIGTTIIEFAERLRDAGLEGVYRAVTVEGVFQIEITRHDAFGVAVTEAVPDVQ